MDGDLSTPSPSYSITMRIDAPSSPSLLPDLSRSVNTVGAVVVAIDLIEVGPVGATVDVTFHARDQDHVVAVTEALTAARYRVRRTSDRTFLYHLGGKIEVVPKAPLRTRDDLSLAYTPGVARISSAIAEQPETAWNLTAKGNSVAIVTDGSAILGLGRLGPLAALPVMEGKSVLFKSFANVNAYPLCLDVASADELVAAVIAVAPGFGGINLEDIASPVCFDVEARLQAALDIPVFHDDQHGTAVVVLAGLINACRATGRLLSELRVVVIGIGAAGTAIANALLEAGVGDLVAVDRDGPLGPGDDVPAHHLALATRTNRGGHRTVADALRGADAFVGVARRGSVDPELMAVMAPRPIVFALSNPDPEVRADELPQGAVYATGRSDLPNQVNNALCFPGLFRGALDARAGRITAAMKHAAAEALAACVQDEERAIGIIIPSIFHPEVHRRVAEGVRNAAESDVEARTRDGTGAAWSAPGGHGAVR
jgi:malate dehydrogenase (oxaloacetate-decarboxylating)